MRSWPEEGPKVLWTVEVGRGYGGPVIQDGKVYLLDRTPSTNPHRRSSPDENNLGKIIGIAPKTGDALWEYDEWECHVSVPSAVDAGDNRVLVVGGDELGAVMIEVEKKADGDYDTKELFETEEFGDQTKPPILHNGHVQVRRFEPKLGTDGAL